MANLALRMVHILTLRMLPASAEVSEMACTQLNVKSVYNLYVEDRHI